MGGRLFNFQFLFEILFKFLLQFYLILYVTFYVLYKFIRYIYVNSNYTHNCHKQFLFYGCFILYNILCLLCS